jgi:excisionase family DNA binding protein
MEMERIMTKPEPELQPDPDPDRLRNRRLVFSCIAEHCARHMEMDRMLTKPEPELQPDPDRLLSTREAAELLCISTRKLWEISNRREIELVRIGRKVLYRRAALLAWIDDQTQAVQR